MTGPAAPPIERTETGELRRVGVEIEFGGLTAHEAAEAIADAADADWRMIGPHLAVVDHPGLGEIRVELDTTFAKPAPRAAGEEALRDALDQLGDGISSVAADIMSLVAPVEITAPPVPWPRLGEFAPVVKSLRRAGASGTGEMPLAAYGMHLNPEIWALAPGPIFRVAAAFAWLEPWLRDRLALDRARRLTPFIDPWPASLGRAFAELASPPDAAALIRLMARQAPSRNHGLDLWPLLGKLDPGEVERARGRPAKSPRPAFHYRLPNADIDRYGWSILPDWALWTRIEAVAVDDRLFRAVRDAWLAYDSWGEEADYFAAARALVDPPA